MLAFTVSQSDKVNSEIGVSPSTSMSIKKWYLMTMIYIKSLKAEVGLSTNANPQRSINNWPTSHA